jgi:hypothetical protein
VNLTKRSRRKFISFIGPYRILAFLMGLQMLCLLSGCPGPESPAPPPVSPALPPPALPRESSVPPPEIPGYYDHTVRWEGETISIITDWYTGDYHNWELVAKANPQLRDPKRISVNDVIRIPKSLMKRQDPMPREHLNKFYRTSPGPPPPKIIRPSPPPPPIIKPRD